MRNVLEKYPLAELIYCPQYANQKVDVELLNSLIDTNFRGCTVVEITPMSVVN